MKNIMLLILTALTSLTVNAQVKSQDLLGDKKKAIVQLQIDRKYLVEKLAIETARYTMLADEVEFIEDYADGKLTANDYATMLTEHPVATNSAAAAALYASARFFTNKFVTPAIEGQSESLVARLMKRFPKLSKNAAYGIAAVVIGANVLATIENTIRYSQFVALTLPERQALYLQKNADLEVAHDNMIVLQRELFSVNAKLNRFTVEETRPIYMR